MAEEKVGFFKKTWKYIVTGITCAVVGAGVTVGADVAKIQETITVAQARSAIVAAAQYSAQTVVANIKGISTASSKAEAVKIAINAVTEAAPQIIEAAKAVKEVKEEVTNIVKDNNAEVTKETKTEVKDAEKVVEKATETVTKAEVKTESKENLTK